MSLTEQTENHRRAPGSRAGVPQEAASPGQNAATSPTAVPRLATAGLTHPGQVRPLNEDSWQVAVESDTAPLWERRGRLLAVADGMGGHAAGEIASRLAIETLYQQYYDEDNVPLPPAIRLERAVSEANLDVYEQAVSIDAQSGMGTTLVAAVMHEGRVLIANVGDSRAYLIRDGQATQITQDHSWVAEQVKLGTITEAQAENHAYRNLVTRCLGHRPGMQVDIFEHRLRTGDTLLLCSDGLSNQVSDAELAAVLTAQEPEQAVQTLVEMANQRGGPDNITAVVARVLDLPAWVTEVAPGAERPDLLASKTTQPVRLERGQIEAAAAAEAPAWEGAARLERGALSRAPQVRGVGRWLRGLRAWGQRIARSRPRLSPRRRASLLLTLIALTALAAVVTLIALRAAKITRWLAWPTQVPELLPTPTHQGIEPASALVLALSLPSLAWPCAQSP